VPSNHEAAWDLQAVTLALADRLVRGVTIVAELLHARLVLGIRLGLREALGAIVAVVPPLPSVRSESER
jgi:hypothetical protein